MSTVFDYWRASLIYLLVRFGDLRDGTRFFLIKLFAAFVALNLVCFWSALLTTYPHLIVGPEADELVLMQVPVGVLGGLFDFLSLFVTLHIAQRAVASADNTRYLAYLSVDLAIAVLASFWVLVVFTVSGWFVDIVLAAPETLGDRTVLYQARVSAAIAHPLHIHNLKNIYFGVVMGASAMLPTLIHMLHAATAFRRWLRTA